MAAKVKNETPVRTRKSVDLPDTVTGVEAAWPGSARGGGGKNTALKAQLANDVESMEVGSVRRYEIAGNDEQDAFLSLFRNVCDRVHDKAFGVQAVKGNGVVFVKLGERRKVTSK